MEDKVTPLRAVQGGAEGELESGVAVSNLLHPTDPYCQALTL